MSADDINFRTALKNMHYAACMSADIKLINSRVVSSSQNASLMEDPNFRNVPIITARNAIRDGINIAGCLRFATETNQALRMFHSLDTLKRGKAKGKDHRSKDLNLDAKQLLWSLLPCITEHIAGLLNFCIGMPVMLKHNEVT